MRKDKTRLRLRATKPNAGIRNEYRKRITALLRELADDVTAQVGAVFSEVVPGAQDAEPASKFGQMMNDLRKRWEQRVDTGADESASWFAQKAAANATRSQKAAMASVGLGDFAVRYDFGNIRADAVQAITAENVGLIKSIAQEYLNSVETLVMRSVVQGRDLKGLATELDHRYDISAKRAALIARDQNNKATECIARTNDLAAGVTQGEWIHVPGRLSSRASHKAMHGKIFNLQEGLYDSEEGRKVKPGELICCNCTYRPIFDFKGTT